jgi:hypothetical protein
VLPPSIAAGWTNLNLGGTGTVVTSGYKRVAETASNAQQIRGQFIALPAVPYDVKVAFSGQTFSGRSLSGIGWYSSTGGELTYIYTQNGNTLSIQKWNSVSSVNSDYSPWPIQYTTTISPFWVRLVDDNTNRIIYLSENGLDWYQIFSIARTDFHTPDSFFIGVASFSTDFPASGTLISYQP